VEFSEEIGMIAESRRDHGKATPSEPYAVLSGEGGAGRRSRGKDDVGAG
jgi:hypothetical protein